MLALSVVFIFLFLCTHWNLSSCYGVLRWLLIFKLSYTNLQLCVWSIDTWDKRKSVPIQLPAGKAPTGDTRVQFHSDQIRLLVSHETQLALYDAAKIDRIRQV